MKHVAWRYNLETVSGHRSNWLFSENNPDDTWPSGRKIDGFEKEKLFVVDPKIMEDLDYLFSCVETHADKFPAPKHMIERINNIRNSIFKKE